MSPQRIGWTKGGLTSLLHGPRAAVFLGFLQHIHQTPHLSRLGEPEVFRLAGVVLQIVELALGPAGNGLHLGWVGKAAGAEDRGKHPWALADGVTAVVGV